MPGFQNASPAHALAEFVATSGEVVSQRARSMACEGIRDAIACMIAGATDPAVDAVHRGVAKVAAGHGSLVGRASTLALPDAAMVNGTAAHALDFDDNYPPTSGHASAVLVPALLALGEARGVKGCALVDAYILGLEAMRLAGEEVQLDQYRRGWHTTVTLGTMGVAAGCSRLLRLDAERTAHAMALSTSMATGSKIQFGTMAKPLHVGLTARAGVMAALMAEAGVTAAVEVLTGPWSLADLLVGRPELTLERSLANLDAVRRGRAPFAIEALGLKLKIHPCCASSHSSIDLMLDLQRAHGFAAADIESIEAVVRETSYRNLMYDAPIHPMQARFSMPYALAAVLVGGGRLRLGDFTEKAVARPEVRSLLPRIHRCIHAPDSPIAHSTVAMEPAEMTIRLRGGREIFGRRFGQRGLVHDPLSAEELDDKLRDCLAASALAARAGEVIAALKALDGPGTIGELMRVLAPGAGQPRRSI